MAGAFETWLRTGRVRTRGPLELKYNPWHDPDDGRFTFANTGRYFGPGSAGMAKRPPQKPPRPGGFRGGGGGFGGAGATAIGIWGPETWPKHKATPPAAPKPAAPKRPKQMSAGRPTVGIRTLPAPKRPSPIRPVRTTPGRTRQTQPARPRREAEGHQETHHGYQFRRDLEGRTSEASGELRLGAAQRSKQNQLNAGKPDRRETDEGGHYIGVQFDGPSAEVNHMAQDRNFNRSGYRKLENKWKQALERKERVIVRIRPSYDGSSRRPATIDVTYKIGELVRSKTFENEPDFSRSRGEAR